MARRFLTDAQIERIIELREKGRGDYAIAEEIGCSRSTVRWHCLREGALPPQGIKPVPAPDQPVIIRRGKHVIRKFTKEEDALLKALDIQGFPLATICKRLGRKHNSVIGRLATLARHDAIAELQAT